MQKYGIKYKEMDAVSHALGTAGTFSAHRAELFEIADRSLGRFAGNNGRYRYGKAVQMGESVRAVLAMAPRYENTAMVLQLRGLAESCKVPLYEIALDGDWDESGWTGLRSFLYYC